MLFMKKAAALKQQVEAWHAAGERIGFVPTMGALHRGHLSLVERARAENDRVICSVFVNPAQFNDATDLEKYPRRLEEDAEMLDSVYCDLLFAPPVEEVYPEGWEPPVFDLKGLDQNMEGTYRPGHFAGVAKVIYRLLELCQAQSIYMGKKDFQQLSVVRRLVEDQNLPVEVVGCTTFRENDGLAMSSRNLRLSPEARKTAVHIYKNLDFIRQQAPKQNLKQLRLKAIEDLKQYFDLVDYLEIVDAKDLQPIEDYETPQEALVCTAVHIDGVRLIDNIQIK